MRLSGGRTMSIESTIVWLRLMAQVRHEDAVVDRMRVPK
jgi:hypothetical protein